jgi:hypothetical protein
VNVAVEAGLPRHIARRYEARWRRPDQIGINSAASTPFILRLLKWARAIARLILIANFSMGHRGSAARYHENSGLLVTTPAFPRHPS